MKSGRRSMEKLEGEKMPQNILTITISGKTMSGKTSLGSLIADALEEMLGIEVQYSERIGEEEYAPRLAALGEFEINIDEVSTKNASSD